MYPILSEITNSPVDEMFKELEVLRLYYEEVIKETRHYLTSTIQKISNRIPQKISQMNDKEVRILLEKLLIQSQVAPLESSMKNLLKNRSKFLFIEESKNIDNEVA